MPHFMSNYKPVNKPLSIVKSALYLLLCWLASIVIVFFFPNSYNKLGVIMCIVFGFCSIGACVCIYGDFAWKLGGRMRISDDRSDDSNPYFGLYLGIIPTAINYIFVFLLYLSKFGVFDFDFFPMYKTLTLYFMPLTYIFAPNTVIYTDGMIDSVNVNAVDLSAPLLIMVTILPLIFILTTHIAYTIGYNKIDVKQRMIYGK